MEKKFKINNNIIMINVVPGYCTDTVKIEKAIFKDDQLDRIISFYIWDDMAFHSSFVEGELYSEITDVYYEIEKDDMIYFALNRMLGKDDILIILDDATYEKFKNYMVFKRSDEKIVISFHDEDIDKPTFDRFKIFIKNIMPDGRSKIDDINVKHRLVKFFREATDILINDYHQYTFDEWFELENASNIFNPFLDNCRNFKNITESCFNCVTDCNSDEKSKDYWCCNYTPKLDNEYLKLIKKEMKNK